MVKPPPRQRLSESNDRSSSYPPYNISKDGNFFAIEVAVAGLSKDDIQIELADGVLSVSYDGPKTEVINGENKVVYQGIAQRAFKQQFTLSNDVVVQGADLINGLLTINLEKIIPDENLSILQGGIAPLGVKKNNWTYKQIETIAKCYDFDLNDPLKSIPEKAKNIILNGSNEKFEIPSKSLGITRT